MYFDIRNYKLIHSFGAQIKACRDRVLSRSLLSLFFSFNKDTTYSFEKSSKDSDDDD